MVRNPALVQAVEEAAKAEWLSGLTMAESFRLVEEMDRFSRKMSPESFLLRTDGAGLEDDPHIHMYQRLRAAFGKVRPPAG